MFHVFACLKNKHNSQLVFDLTHPEIDMSQFNEAGDWKHFCGDVKEAVPMNALKPPRKEVNL